MTSLVDATELVWNTQANSARSSQHAPPHDEALFHIDLQAVIQSLGWKKKQQAEQSVTKMNEKLHNTAPWLTPLTSEQGYEQVLDHSALLQEGGVFPADHLFRGMAQTGQVQDTRVLVKHVQGETPTLDLIVASQLGSDVCGHAGIVHGGLTAALIDETYGYLLYVAKDKGILSFDMVFTANLEVAYKQPLLPNRPVCITAWITSVDGRKVWVQSAVTDKPLTRPSGVGDPEVTPEHQVFATSKALFLKPRPAQ